MINNWKNFALLLVLSGCASSLSPEGRRVTIIPSPAPHDCERLRSFKSEHSDGTATSVALRAFEADIKNKAGEQGANYVSVTPAGTSGTHRKVVAMGLKCEANSVRLHYSCLSGDSSACVDYSKLLEARKFKEGQEITAQAACRLGSSIGCLLSGRERVRTLKLLSDCDSGIYRSCGELGKYFVGIKKYGSGIEYLRLACEGGHTDSCPAATRLAHLEADEIRRLEAIRRAEANQRFNQAQFGALLMMDQFWNSNSEKREPASSPTNCVSNPVYDGWGKFQRTSTVCQ